MTKLKDSTFVGTPEDQRQWREDYIREWNERKKNDQEQ